MKLTIAGWKSWSSDTGFSINGISQSNVANPRKYMDAIGKALIKKKTQLVSGEVHVCARFGDNWRGMKIIKK